MSYEIVKSITIKNGEVFTRQESNNDQPRTFIKDINPYLTKINKEKGTSELINFIIIESLCGNIKFKPENRLSREIEEIVERIRERKDFQQLSDKQDYLCEQLVHLQLYLTEKEKLNMTRKNKEIEEVEEKIKEIVKKEITKKEHILHKILK